MENSSLTFLITTASLTTDTHKHDGLEKLEQYMHSNVHTCISLTICVLGIVMNALTLLVLTKKSMRTPTNLLLSSISIADLLTILMYMPRLVVVTVDPLLDKTKAFVYYKLVFAHVSLLSHTTSIWLTVCLCVFRCLIVLIQNGKKYTRFGQTAVAIAGVVLATTLLVLPSFILLRVHSTLATDDCESGTICDESTIELWFIDIGRINATLEEKQSSESIYNIQMWMVAVFGKLLPCVLVAVMCTLLVRKLWQIQSRYQVMTSPRTSCKPSTATQVAAEEEPCLVNSAENVDQKITRFIQPPNIETPNGIEIPRQSKSRNTQTNRTTVMLLVVVFTVFLAEFPIALLLLLSQALGKEFFDHIYLQLAGIFDLLIILNSSGNFLIYCSMSNQFRFTFLNIFGKKRANNLLLLKNGTKGGCTSHRTANGTETQYSSVAHSIVRINELDLKDTVV